MIFAVALPYTSFGQWFGFVPLPANLLAAIALTTAVYLLLAQAVKTLFYSRHSYSPAIRSLKRP